MVARAASDDPDAPMVHVAKKSTAKATIGGRKYPWRRFDATGVAETELIGIDKDPQLEHGRPLLVPLVVDGEIVGREPLTAARERHERARAELPLDALKMSRGEPVIETVFIQES
jgi:nicotinate phosphoribosyltransferase